MVDNYYQILEVPSDADARESSALITSCAVFHPDKAPTPESPRDGREILAGLGGL
jgi:DnaJ-class molecular chaperone